MKIQIIADEVFADGCLVAVLTSGGLGMTEQEFCDFLQDLDTEELIERNALLEAITKQAAGGLIRLSAVEEIFDVTA